MKRTHLLQSLLLLFIAVPPLTAQQHTDNKADQTIRGSARVNPSTLALELQIPLTNYRGRGIEVPLSISYSSKVWRLNYSQSQPAVNNPDTCIAINEPRYAENSAAGWTTSLAVPFIEYVGADNIYDSGGKPAGTDDPGCTPNTPPGSNSNAWVRRVALHLPSGEVHELRMNDEVLAYLRSSNCDDNDPQTICDPNDPALPRNWDGWYYAIDGSNIRYFEDRTNGVFFVQMPDGSRYDLNQTIGGSSLATIRKANKLIDRNGNFTTYHEPDPNFPNGYWIDTIGRVIPVPFRPEAPAEPMVQVFGTPGLGGQNIWYKFHWKRLKGSSPEESALTDFAAQLRFVGDKFIGNNSWQTRPAGQALFTSDFEAWVIDQNQRFNPVVLAAVELPNGQRYGFSYNVFGEIETVNMPTGGEERFQISTVGAISDLLGPNAQVNRGAVNRKVFESPGSSNPYIWHYAAQSLSASAFQVTITNPDGTRLERLLHRGNAAYSADSRFGFDNALGGMELEERVLSSTNRVVSRKMTNWVRTTLPVTMGGLPTGTADWHPRVASVESVRYDDLGNGVSATTQFEFNDAANLNLPETPLLTKTVRQFGYVPVGSQLPAIPIRYSVSTYLISDRSLPPATRDGYRNANLVGLVSASELRDGTGNVLSRIESRFDESDFSASAVRGNPTSNRIWDNTRGAISNPTAYVVTRSRFDEVGNQIESVDARGNSTLTEFDPAYRTFPIRVTTPVPDPTGIKGSSAPFATVLTYDASSGLQTSETDINGLETRVEYDPVTLRIRAVRNYFQGSETGNVTETSYSDGPGSNRIKTRTRIDAENWIEQVVFSDGLGREYKTQRSNASGDVFIQKEFDPEGRTGRVSNPFRNGEAVLWTTYEYDEASRIKKVIRPDGSTVATDWGVLMGDLTGTTKTITDEAGKKRKGVFDALDRLVRVNEDPSGLNYVTDYLFDAAGNLRRTTQGEQSRYFAFDSMGRLIYSKQPEQDALPSLAFTDPVTGNTQWSMKYEYDATGNITKTTDSRAVTAVGTFDGLNRLVRRDYSDDTPDIDYYFDGMGLDVPAANALGKTTRVATNISESRYTEFDPWGRVLRSEQRTDGRTFASGYAYNLAGALVSETYPSGRTVLTELNRDGQIDGVSDIQPGKAPRRLANNMAYNANGDLQKLRFGNGRWETVEYNSRQQITRIGLGYSESDRSLIDIGYGYGLPVENNGALRTQSISYRGLGSSLRQNYEYDSLNRLRSASESGGSGGDLWRQLFEYDRYGNRHLQNGTTTLSSSTSAKAANPLSAPANNRLRRDQDGDGAVDYEYDPSGNLVLDAENRRFVFDAENRLKWFFKGTNTTPDPDGIYRYDGDGKRVLKVTVSEKTIFVHNALGKLVAEYSTVSPTKPKTSFLTADHLGSPRIVTDGGGVVVSRHDYLAFGEDLARVVGLVGGRTAASGYAVADEVRQQYTGYERDDETGLDFAPARCFSAAHGRFTSVDPLTASANLKNPQSFNRYSYALNSPYKFVDPLGLVSSSTGADGNAGPRKPNKRRPQTRQTTKLPPPNPNIIVPKNVQAMARNSTVEANSRSTGKTVDVQIPATMVDLQVEIANYVYSHIGAAVSQENANSRFGAINPQIATQTETVTQSEAEATTNAAEVSAELSTDPTVSVSGSNSTESTQGTTGGIEASLSGKSTDTRGIQNEVAKQVNIAITNYLNENSDINGNIAVTVVDQNNVKSRGVVERGQFDAYLRSFASRIHGQAYKDFGGR